MLCYIFMDKAKDSQKIKKIKKKTKIPRITDEWWNSQKQLSGPVEKPLISSLLVSRCSM